MSRPDRRAITLVELLVVIFIIAVLMALLMPAIRGPRANGRQAACINSQRQIALAINNYSSTHRHLPPTRTTALGGRTLSWTPTLLQELGYGAVYDAYKYDANGVVIDDVSELGVKLAILECRSDPALNEMQLGTEYSKTEAEIARASPTSYVLNAGLPNRTHPSLGANCDFQANGVFDDLAIPWNDTGRPDPSYFRPSVRAKLSYIAEHDGVAHTLAVTENVNAHSWALAPTEWAAGVVWDPDYSPGTTSTTSPFDEGQASPLSFKTARPSARHPGVFIVSFCDASTRRISDKIDYSVWSRLMTSNGSETLDPAGNSTASPFPQRYQAEPFDPNELD